MNKSNEVNEVFGALSKAQGDMKPAVMDSKNPHFNSKFASLTAVQDAYRGPLAKNGLAITQMVESDENGYTIQTILGHASGQYISSTFRLMVTKQDMQGLGSAVTYARRYAISALLGVVDTEDDDAEASLNRSKPQAQRPTPTPKAAGAAVKNQAPASMAQIKQISALANDRSISKGVLGSFVTKVYGADHSTLKRWQADEIVALLEDAGTNEATVMAAVSRSENQQLSNQTVQQ